MHGHLRLPRVVFGERITYFTFRLKHLCGSWAPVHAALHKLRSLTEHGDAGVRYLSGSGTLERSRQALVTPHEAGLSQRSWLWAAPAKHSPRQIEELIERIETPYELGVHRHLIDVSDDLVRRYARRLSSQPPLAGRLIREPVRTIEVAYFLRYCLLTCNSRVSREQTTGRCWARR